MKDKNLLDKKSLSETIDMINEAHFYGSDFKEFNTDETVKWILSRYDTEYSYNGSFGITERDWQSKLRAFTGEMLSSPASLRHIHAEEAGRALTILKKHTSVGMPQLKESDKKFIKIFLLGEKAGKHEGTFCCGPCTVSLWRNMSAGGYGSYAKKLNSGFSVLRNFRSENGQWKRFPFYYTLSVLLESADLPNSKTEIEYVYDLCGKKMKRLKGGDKYSERRHEILRRILDL